MPEKVIAYILRETSEAHPVKVLQSDATFARAKVVLQDYAENRNKRLYSKDVITEALSMPHVHELRTTGNWFGEAGHPLDDSPKRQMTIFLANVSHKILDFSVGDDLTEGIIQTSHFEMGKSMRDEMLIGGMQAAFSMRGVGPVVESASMVKVIQKGLKILTYDWVIYPSHKTAYQKYLIREGASIGGEVEAGRRIKAILENGSIIPLTESAFDDVFGKMSAVEQVREMIMLDPKNIHVVINEQAGVITLSSERTDVAIPLGAFGTNKRYVDYMAHLGKKN